MPENSKHKEKWEQEVVNIAFTSILQMKTPTLQSSRWLYLGLQTPSESIAFRPACLCFFDGGRGGTLEGSTTVKWRHLQSRMKMVSRNGCTKYKTETSWTTGHCLFIVSGFRRFNHVTQRVIQGFPLRHNCPLGMTNLQFFPIFPDKEGVLAKDPTR